MNKSNKDAILVISFGTSYENTRERTIGAIEKRIAEDFKGYEIRRAFTSGMIINKLRERDGIEIDTVDKAAQRLADEGFRRVIVQPTHVMNGYEYDKLSDMIEPYRTRFDALICGSPLLSSDNDYIQTIEAIADETPEMKNSETAVVFVGHGTGHFANASYAAFAYRLGTMGYNNCFVGTVEAFPDIDDVTERVRATGAKKVLLLPLMIVAGDHVINDIGGEDKDTWLTRFRKAGYQTRCVRKGLGEYEGIRRIFSDHVRESLNRLSQSEM